MGKGDKNLTLQISIIGHRQGGNIQPTQPPSIE